MSDVRNMNDDAKFDADVIETTYSEEIGVSNFTLGEEATKTEVKIGAKIKGD